MATAWFTPPSIIPRGTRKNFGRGARVMFWGLKFDKLLFFGVARNDGYFFGVEKNKHYFLDQPEICITFLVAEKINYRITS